MINAKKIGIIGLILIFLFSMPAFAQEFSAGGDALLETYQYDSVTTQLSITNDGGFATNYQVGIEGKPGKWAKVTPETLILAPGQKGTFTIKYSPEGAKAGLYDVYTHIIDREGYEKILSQILNVIETSNLAMTAIVFEQEVTACTEAAYEIEIVNSGTFVETYDLEINKFKDESKVSINPVTIEAGQKETIEITITPESCKEYGEYVIELTAEAQTSGIKATVDLDLTILSDGIVTLSGPLKLSNKYTETSIKYTIKNTGKETEFTLTAIIPDWMKLEPSVITVAEGQKESFMLVINAPEDVDAGEYPITITASSNISPNKYSTETLVQLNKPGIVETFYKNNKAMSNYILGGLAALIILIVGMNRFRKSDKYKQIKKNRDKKKESRKKAKDKKNAAKIAKKKEKQKEAEKKRAAKEKQKLKTQIESDIRKEYKLIARKDFLKKTSGKAKKWILGILLGLIIVAAAFGTWYFWEFILQYKSYFKWGMISAATLIVLIVLGEIISSKFRRKQKWKLLEARRTTALITGFKNGIGEVRFKLNGAVKKAKVVVKKIRKPEFVAPEETVYQYFKVEANFDEKGVDKAQYKFRVRKSWLRRINGLESQLRLKRYHNGKWTGIKTDKLTEDKKYFYFQAETDSFGLFVIVGKERPKEKNRKALWWTLAGLIVIAVAINGLVLTPAGPGMTAGIPAQVWDEDTQHVLDLTKYFTDPDDEVLEFTHTKVEHVTIDIVSGQATLTPEENWSGEERIVFTAIDSEGASVSSNTVRLLVVKRSELIPQSIKNLISPFKYQILTGFVILALLIVGMELRRKKK